MTNDRNTLQSFWKIANDCEGYFGEKAESVSRKSIGILSGQINGPAIEDRALDEVIEYILAERQYGSRHWKIGVLTKLFYTAKPFLPKSLARYVRILKQRKILRGDLLNWPIDSRYVNFIYQITQDTVDSIMDDSVMHIGLWPKNKKYAFAISHDVESEEGVRNMINVARLDQKYGFTSSFNIVPEKYSVPEKIIEQLRQMGFEIGIHGLNHDGKLFWSRKRFRKRVRLINQYLKNIGAVGFRSPSTFRNPEWMQMIEATYDSSFFDTDPFEPMPGGAMSIWPYFLGKIIELPYTLMQDHTLTEILNAVDARPWIEKTDYIKVNRGLVLMNTHPDYLTTGKNLKIYEQYLCHMSKQSGYWHALPRDIAGWWRARESNSIIRHEDEYILSKDCPEMEIVDLKETIRIWRENKNAC